MATVAAAMSSFEAKSPRAARQVEQLLRRIEPRAVGEQAFDDQLGAFGQASVGERLAVALNRSSEAVWFGLPLMNPIVLWPSAAMCRVIV
jgi:hypothetical protein